MKKTVFLFAFVFVWALYGETLSEKVSTLLDDRTYTTHRKLIGLLFENESEYRTDSGYDMGKVVEVLKENGLLHLELPSKEKIEMKFEYDGENPLFFVKMVDETLRGLGIANFLTKEARLDREKFRWSVLFVSDRIPDPALLASRLKKRGARVMEIERCEKTKWRYRIDVDGARMDALPMEAGEVKKVVRPMRPIWIDVSKVESVVIRELPGSHWYPDVVVYDKMLRILSMKQSDRRSRYMRLKLPERAAYLKIDDRFTLENLRSGLKLNARGEK
ncbi:hypothetical protein [Hydrogenimonas sp.]